MRKVFWRPHPFTIITSFEGQEIQDYNPRPKAVDPRRLTELLLRLPTLQHAKSLVASCRLYALALELLHERPDISYQLLISSVESIANGTLRSFQPLDDAKVEHQKTVYDLALSLELGEETARKLAIEACRREWWARKKFKKFLMDNVADSVWTEQDELFHRMQQDETPKREEFERTLSEIYDARSKATHEGQPFPVSASYTGGPSISIRAASVLFGTDSPFPPCGVVRAGCQQRSMRILGTMSPCCVASDSSRALRPVRRLRKPRTFNIPTHHPASSHRANRHLASRHLVSLISVTCRDETH